MEEYDFSSGPNDRYVWIGMVTSGLNARAKRVGFCAAQARLGETPAHHHFNMEGGKRWRYPEGSNSVFWWEPPDRG